MSAVVAALSAIATIIGWALLTPLLLLALICVALNLHEWATKTWHRLRRAANPTHGWWPGDE